MVDAIGVVRTKELLLTGRLVHAEEAAAIGLATKVVASSAIGAEVQELAERLRANAPRTMLAGKEAVRRIQEARRLHAQPGDDLVTACYLSDDFREGVAAFLARRPPRFTGH
jgi:enoyl-CoA hydratase/carnithine racemase